MTVRKKLNNPFVTVGYVSPEYFCDREKETGQIAEIIHSNRNLALISVRRIMSSIFVTGYMPKG